MHGARREAHGLTSYIWAAQETTKKSQKLTAQLQRQIKQQPATVNKNKNKNKKGAPKPKKSPKPKQKKQKVQPQKKKKKTDSKNGKPRSSPRGRQQGKQRR